MNVTARWVPMQREPRAATRAVLDLAAELASRRLPPGRLISEPVNEPPAQALLDRAAEAEMLVLGTTRPDRQPGQPPPAMGIAGGHETARPRHHEPRQIASLFLIRFDHADKLALVTETSLLTAETS
jgi:hypothetical protein